MIYRLTRLDNPAAGSYAASLDLAHRELFDYSNRCGTVSNMRKQD